MNRKIIFCLLIAKGITSLAQVSIQDSLNKKEIRKALIKEERQKTYFSLTNVGLEVAQPTFRNNFELQGLMQGPTLQYMGLMEAGLLKGTASKKDNSLVTSQATMYYLGFKYNHLLLASRSLNFGPTTGLRFMLNSLNDPLFDGDGVESNTFTIGTYLGAFAKVGPVTVNAKINVDGNINFSQGSSYKPLGIYPSFGVAFSPLEIILNPKEFSHTAMAHWTSDHKNTVSKYTEYRATGVYDVTEFKSTWIDNYGLKDMKCKDVQPFFFIGPRIHTNASHFDKSSLISAYGLNVGYRRGALFLNSFIEKANIQFKEPFERSYDTTGFYQNVFLGRTDGEFKNSTKYGAQIGVELINWLQSKDFIYEESRVERATAFTSWIFYAGLGKAHLGQRTFYSDSGQASITNYMLQNKSDQSNAKQNVLITPSSPIFGSFGMQFGFGAVALNLEYSAYNKSYKEMNTWNAGISYNLPVTRIVRAVRVAGLKRDVRKLVK